MRSLTYRPKVIARHLLIGLALLGVIAATIGAIFWLVGTSETYQQRADEHAKEAAIHEANRSATIPPWSNDEARKAEYHSKMNRKWEYAASHPWIYVEPDPPRPK